MSEKPRIPVIGPLGICHGAHFCRFYQMKKDFADTLFLFFGTGLENYDF